MSSKNNQKIVILGYVQVGRAIAKFYKKQKIKALNRNESQARDLALKYKSHS